LIGPIQVDILERLHGAPNGLPVVELLRNYRYKQGGERSLASLKRAGYIRVANGLAHFERYPEEMQPRVTIKTYSPEQLDELDDMSRMNLLYLYQDELAKYKDGVVPASALPTGVKRSLQHLGVIKWKILELTDLGRRLLGEILSRSTAPMPALVGY
jgi:hypothetical protein